MRRYRSRTFDFLPCFVALERARVSRRTKVPLERSTGLCDLSSFRNRLVGMPVATHFIGFRNSFLTWQVLKCVRLCLCRCFSESVCMLVRRTAARLGGSVTYPWPCCCPLSLPNPFFFFPATCLQLPSFCSAAGQTRDHETVIPHEWTDKRVAAGSKDACCSFPCLEEEEGGRAGRDSVLHVHICNRP